MPRKPDERITQAKELYLKGQKLIEIASQLGVSGRNSPKLEK